MPKPHAPPTGGRRTRHPPRTASRLDHCAPGPHLRAATAAGRLGRPDRSHCGQPARPGPPQPAPDHRNTSSNPALSSRPSGCVEGRKGCAAGRHAQASVHGLSQQHPGKGLACVSYPKPPSQKPPRTALRSPHRINSSELDSCLNALAAHQTASQLAARSRASTGRSPAWTPWVAVTVSSTTPFGMACRTTRPMASTTSTKARILRCVPRRDGVSIGSSVAKQSRGWSAKSATSGQDGMARVACGMAGSALEGRAGPKTHRQ